MKNRKLVLSLIIIIAVFFLIISSGKINKKINHPFDYAANFFSPQNKLSVMVILDRINLNDINDEMTGLNNLIKKGCLSLMNVRTGGGNAASGYLTLGSGVRASSSSKGNMTLEHHEEYEGQNSSEVFENFTGTRPDEENIIVLDIQRIIADNYKLNYDLTPGLLGELLRENGISVSILGNADIPKEKERLASLIAMDTGGVVEKGSIGNDLSIEDYSSPFFIKTNYERLFKEFIKHRANNGLIVIYLGDIVRADKYTQFVSQERNEFFRAEALKKADEFIGKISTELDFSRDLLMIVTPNASQCSISSKDMLTPFIMTGPGIKEGYAFSQTTRRNGIITNMDVAPTILSFYDIPLPVQMLGSRILSIKEDDVLPVLLEKNKQIVSTHIQRSYLIKPYVGLQVVICLGFLILILVKKEGLKYFRPLILASMCIPLVFLILSKFASNTLLSKYIWVLVLSVVLVAVTIMFRRTLFSVILISLLTAFAITGDLALGAPLMKTSILGYDAIGGSRYYGLGNEYMGVLIGSVVIGCTALADSYQFIKPVRYFTVITFFSVFYFIFSPGLGSNVGGTISAFGAFFMTILLSYGIRPGLKHLLFMGLSLLGFLSLLFLLVSPLFPPSHISKTVEVVKVGGFKTVFQIITRKISMNLMLFRYTVWTRALLASIVVIAVLIFRPPFVLKEIFKRKPYLYNGFIGTGVGCLLALIFNDSGIVAAATMMIYIVFPILLIVIDEIEEKKAWTIR